MASLIQFSGNRIKETTTTTGTGGVYDLDGAATGYKTFVSENGDGGRFSYTMEDESGNWEIGIGTVASGTPDTITRSAVIESSNSNAAVNWAAGTKTIAICSLSSDMNAGQTAQNIASSFMFLEASTTDATPTVMNQTAETGEIVVTQWFVSMMVVGQNSTDSKAWEAKALFDGSGLVGTATKTVVAESSGASAWDIDIDVDLGTSDLEITVTGAAATNISWYAKGLRC